MFKSLTATALAASIALTSFTAAPARAADSGEIARTILGAGVLLYLGNELSKQNHNRGYVTRRYVEPRYDDRDYRQRGHRKVVPAACLRTNEYRDGPRRYFGQRCVAKNMRHANRLPNYCLTNVHTRRGWATVYSAHCLRKNGWTFG